MTHESLSNRGWEDFVWRLGGVSGLMARARETKAFPRARGFKNAIDMLRMISAYCLGDRGLRAASAWAASTGLADAANTARLYRPRQSEKRLTLPVEQALARAAPRSSGGRPIRVVDGAPVSQAGGGGTFALGHRKQPALVASKVTMNEDRNRARKDNNPYNLAVLRHIALNLIRKDASKGSMRIKFKRAAWKDGFLEKILAQVQGGNAIVLPRPCRVIDFAAPFA